MLSGQFSLYIGRENEQGYTDFIAEETFYCVIEIEEGYTKEQGKVLVAALKEKSKRPIDNLYSFELLIADTLKQANVPVDISLAAFLRKGDMLYLKTTGSGQIFLNRSGEFARLIEGDNTASGYLKEYDFFVLTTARFTRLVGDDKQLKHMFSPENLEKNIENLGVRLENERNQGTIALFLLFKHHQPIQEVVLAPSSHEGEELKKDSKPSIFASIKDRINSLRSRQQSRSRRIITMVAVALIAIILLWSVILGYKRKSESELYKQINASTQIIDHKLTQAEEVATLNLPNAIALIVQVKEELNHLKEVVGDKKLKEVAELEVKIKEKEQRITKKEEKPYTEFFDLTVDTKSAAGDRLFLDDEDLVILDKKRGVLYTLSLRQKSLDNVAAAVVKQAQAIGKTLDTWLVFLPGSGIYTIDVDNKSKKVIDVDKDWGKIVDLNVFNSNIYLLDAGKNDIYKYIAADEGYGTKSSYLKGQTLDLTESNSLAIDSAVYIGFSDGTLKFNGGVAEDFKTSFPEDGVEITKIITSEDVEKVYAWDKSKSAVYVLSKNGTYERQIKSDIFSKAKDVIVYDKNVFALSGSKIYTIPLE